MEKVLIDQSPYQETNTAMSELACSPLFKPASFTLSLEERTKLTYQRAKAISEAYGKVFPRPHMR